MAALAQAAIASSEVRERQAGQATEVDHVSPGALRRPEDPAEPRLGQLAGQEQETFRHGSRL